MTQRTGRTRRAGFTLAEMILVMAIIAVAAAIVLAAVAGRARRGTTGALAGTFTAVSGAIQEFRGDVRHYPSQVDLLTTTPTGSDADACGNAFSTAARNRWAGPYLQRHVPAGGLPAGTATVLNDFQRSPTTGTPQQTATLFIIAIDVDADIAAALEEEFDGDGDDAAGAIRYITGSTTDTVKFAIPIRGC
jgi:prepilin-type N-terminal cleavage/methylation domain-containing protein